LNMAEFSLVIATQRTNTMHDSMIGHRLARLSFSGSIRQL
jgi:hypothetical protein